MNRVVFTVLFCVVAAGCSSEPETLIQPTERSTDWFLDETDVRGIAFNHVSGAEGSYYIPEAMGGGVALLDVDNDDDLDIYFVQSGSIKPSTNQKHHVNELYINDGTGMFTLATESGDAGTDLGYGMGVAVGDYDNDGDADIFVSNLGHNALLRNDGNYAFKNVALQARVDDASWGSSAAFTDFDKDGDLDLFVVNYLRWSPGSEIDCYHWQTGGKEYCSPTKYKAPAQDRLFENNGDGTFTDVTWESGLGHVLGNGLGIVITDVNGDDLQDVVVANDITLNHLWINLGQLKFAEEAMIYGVATDEHGVLKAGMGIVAEDFDDDLDEDVLIVNLIAQTDTYFRNDSGYFTDQTAAIGLNVSSQKYTRFGLVAADFNNDTYLDIFQANGAIARTVEPFTNDVYAEPNVLYPGSVKGKFEETVVLSSIYTSRGAAVGDLNHDGSLDLVVSNRDGPAKLFMNQTSGNWLRVRVLDEDGSSSLGARVSVRLNDRTLSRRVKTSGSYLSARSEWTHFGLGSQGSIDSVEIRWPNGKTMELDSVDTDQSITIQFGQNPSFLTAEND